MDHTLCRVTESTFFSPDLVAIENTVGSLHFVRYMDLYGEVTTFRILLEHGHGRAFTVCLYF